MLFLCVFYDFKISWAIMPSPLTLFKYVKYICFSLNLFQVEIQFKYLQEVAFQFVCSAIVPSCIADCEKQDKTKIQAIGFAFKLN